MKGQLHRLGFGSWQIGGVNFVDGRHTGWGDIDRKQAIDSVLYAIDHGISFFDTADAYGNGRSEDILGEAFTRRPDIDVTVCTKFGSRRSKHGNSEKDFSGQWTRTAVENSLRRLKKEHIDILLLHSPADDFDWQNYDASVLEQLIRDGKIGRYGVSAHTVYGAQNAIQNNFGHAIEVIYNALDRRAADMVFNLNPNRYFSIARVPLASGFLASRYLSSRPEFADNDIRSQLSDNVVDWLLEAVHSLAFLDALPGGMSVSALRFCFNQPNLNMVIPGMRTVEQVRNNLQAAELGILPLNVTEKIYQAVIDVPDAWKR